MSKTTQTIRVVDTGATSKLEIHAQEHVPSWLRYAEGGYAHFAATFHNAAGWLSLDMSEGHEKGRKETMFTLEPEAAKALYDFLHKRFGGK